MALPDIEKKLMQPEERSRFEIGKALRSLKRSRGKFRYQHIKSPTSEQDVDYETLANIAFGHAEKAGGSPEEITKNAKSYYDYMVSEQQKRAGRQGREMQAAIKAGAAETPGTVMPTVAQEQAIKKGGEWSLTEEQAKLRLAKSGVIPPEQIRHFMMGKYTPETKKLLDESMGTPQVGAPDKFEGGETTWLGRKVGALFDILGTGGRAGAGGKAAEVKEIRESGRLRDMALGKESPYTTFISPVKQLTAAGKAAVMSDEAPSLEAEILKSKEDLVRLAFEEAEKELEGFSGKDITTLAKHKYEQYKEKLGPMQEFFLEHPSGVSTAYEIVADPLMYLGGAPYKAGAAVVKKAVPKAAQKKVVETASKMLSPISYEAQFWPLEMAGESGKKLARGLRFAETNLGPGAKRQIDDIAKETSNLLRRVKNKDKEIFFDVVHKNRPIEDLPEYLHKIIPDVQKLGDSLYKVKVAGGTGQTLLSPKGKYIQGLKGTGVVGDKLAREMNYVHLNIGKDQAVELASGWERIRKFAIDEKLKVGQFKALLKYADEGAELPEFLAKNNKIKTFAEVMRFNTQALRKRFKIPEKIEKGKIVQEAAYRKDYGSPLMYQKGGKMEEAADAVETMKTRYRGPVTGSTMHRTGKGDYVKDIEKQYQYALEAESKVLQTAAAYRGVKEASEEIGAWTVYRPTRKVSSKKAAANAALAFTRATGNKIEFVPLDTKLTKSVLQVTEAPGTVVKKGSQVILPKESAKAIERLAKIQGTEESAKGFGKLYNSTIRPLQNIWRVNATILRSPAFLATNFVGAIGLGGLAHGLRALNPKLQAGALRTAATAAFGGSSKALKSKLKLIDGEERALWELFDIMRHTGIIGQYSKRYALDMPGLGPLGKLERQYRKIPEKLKLQQLAALGDEYQHAVAFLGSLKSTSPKHIAEAADFTAKFAGNFNRLTHVEKNYLKEIVGFYNWNRFILPHITKQIFENPQRLLVWEKLKKGWEEYYGKNRPVLEAGIPNWMKYQTAATAPESMQPDDPHEMAMIAIESPQATLGALVGEEAIPMMLGPGTSALVEMITGIDLKTGFRNRDIEAYVPDAIETKQGLIKLAEKSLPFGEAFHNLAKLYWDWGQPNAAAETWLKYRVARDWLNIDRIVTGQDVLSVPGVTKTYAFRPMQEAAKKAYKATK